jgi:carboxyl-terminal processing protease
MIKHTHPLRTAIRFGLISLVLAGLAACGGGGDSSSARFAGSELITTSESVEPSNANRCAAPRSGPNIKDQLGSLDNEKAWVRALMDKTYLWYDQIPLNVNAADFTAASKGSNYKALDSYFKALKTKGTTTPSGRLVDQFSFTVSETELTNQQGGVSSGYGMRLAVASSFPPRDYRVLYVEKNSPAEIAGIARGDRIMTVDGVDLINEASSTGITTLNNGLFPVVSSKTTQFGLQAPGATTIRIATATSSVNIAVNPVAITKTFSVSTSAGTKNVGYLMLNSFGVNTAEIQLFNAINQLKAANITELVLDLRYNGGGYLAISSQLSWMIGGASLQGKVFERTVCNNKNPFSFCNEADPFLQTSVGFSMGANQPLPQLGLSRVFVLTTGSTCSASESVINALDPFLQVIRIGNTTCGKPYGFQYFSNCGTSYAAMHFKGENAVGFGNYADGFMPNCSVDDDLSKLLGNPAEGMLSAALGYVQSGSCPALNSQKIASRSADGLASTGEFKIIRSPLEEQRWYKKQP